MALKRVDSTVTVDNVITNTSTNIIKITEDKLTNILNEHIGKLKRPRDLIGALALTISMLGIMCTTDFKETLGLTADTWRGIFIVLFLLSFGYMVVTIVNCIRYRVNVKSIMKDVKNEDKC